jgi:succinoglycan biosynthesis transport protein ExoP
MLQVKTAPPFVTDNPEALHGSNIRALDSFTGIVRRQLPVFLFLVASSTMLGLLYHFITPPSFTAYSTMVIDPRRVHILQQQSVRGEAIGEAIIDPGMMHTQIEIVKSPNISLSVIKDLGLIEDPEFVGGGDGLLGTAFKFITNLLRSDEKLSDVQLRQRALAAFERRRTVSPVGQSYVIEIGFQSLEPAKAARIANAIADAYILDQLNSTYQATLHASVWLQDRIKELRTQASDADRAVVDFKRAKNIIESGNGRLMSEQQLSEVNSQLILARAATAEAKARLDRIRNVMKQDVPDASVAEALHSEIIIHLRNQYLDDAARERVWEEQYGANHLAAANLRTQMLELRRNINDEMKKIAESFESDYEIALAREQRLTSSLANVVAESQTTNEAQIQLRQLESTAQSYRIIYDNFLQRFMESVQQQSFPITEARLIGPATPPAKQNQPGTLGALAMAIGGGVVFGFAVAFFLDASDRVFRTGGDIEKVLRTDYIATLPALKLANPPADRTGEVAPQAPRTIPYERILRFVVDSPFSQFAEGFRAVKVVTDLKSALKSDRVIGVTSTLPNEGKSTISSNFAHLIAHAGDRVILIDCDLRNPCLSRQLAPGAVEGVVDIIAGKIGLDDAVWTEPSTGLLFLPAGATSKLLHTNRILASDAMKKFIDSLREACDYVIVDFPPLAPMVDTRVTTGFVDFYIYVVEWGRTKRDIVRDAIVQAPEIHERLLGVIMNKANMRVMSRYEGYASRHSYRKQYSRYGYVE